MENIEGFDIHSRPVLFDRIQVNVRPNYVISKNSEGYANLTDWIVFFRVFKKYKLRQPVINGKKKYYVDIPGLEGYPFVSDISINGYHPYECSFKLNFIRLLKFNIENKLGFRNGYDKDIMLDDDNYVNYESWPYWDSNLVSKLNNELRSLCLNIAQKVIDSLIGPNDLIYTDVSVSQVETNIDYFVGRNLSFYFMNKLPEYMTTIDGRDFIQNIKAISMKHYDPDITDSVESSVVDKNNCDSIQFMLAQGLWLKFYRKDKDHIRSELVFHSKFLKRKFKGDISTKFYNILDFSKDLFKNANIEMLLYHIYNNKSNSVYINQLQNIFDFYSNVDPVQLDIINCLLNPELPISDKKVIDYLKERPSYRSLFVSEINQNKGRVYFYDPFKASLRKKPVKVLSRNDQLLPNYGINRYSAQGRLCFKR